jgi:hypothetical protein
MNDSPTRTPTECLARQNEVDTDAQPNARTGEPTTNDGIDRRDFSIPRSRKRHEVDPGGRIHLCACGGLVPAGLCPPFGTQACMERRLRRRPSPQTAPSRPMPAQFSSHGVPAATPCKRPHLSMSTLRRSRGSWKAGFTSQLKSI